MTHGRHWLYTAGKLAITGENRASCLVPSILSVGEPSQAILIPVKSEKDTGRVWSERVFFLGHPIRGVSTKADLNYKIVANEFGRLFPHIDDSRIAQDIVMRMVGRASQQTFNENQRNFVAGMTALMFGVEASRFPSSLATSLFLLDLIIYGMGYGREGTKKFTLAKSFHSGDWDNGEWYGGKYPYAVHGTGSGNMRMRSRIAVRDQPAHFDNLVNLPQRHAVPRREVTLLIHWLEANLSKQQLVALTPDAVFDLIKARLELSYVAQELAAPFDHAPRRFTGVHAHALDQRPSLVSSGGIVFWYDGGSFYHVDPKCKTLPGYQARPPTPVPAPGLPGTKLLVPKPPVPQELFVGEFLPKDGDFNALRRYGYDRLRDDQKRRIDKHDEMTNKADQYLHIRSGSVATASGPFNKKRQCPVCLT
ncbi:hypothetical protein [Cystobacter ferrugineus]|nr:hypothetical protein [Cystobacter ferrugineus]